MTPTTGCLILAVVCVGVCGLAISYWFDADEAEEELKQVRQSWAENSQSLFSQLEIKDAEIKRLTMQLQPTPVLPLSTSIDRERQLATTTHHNRDLQAKIAELESERRAYDLTVANCDHLRAENERLTSQLEAVGIKPAEVMAAEHDFIHATRLKMPLILQVAPESIGIPAKCPNCGPGLMSVSRDGCMWCDTCESATKKGKPPRVRDDETND